MDSSVLSAIITGALALLGTALGVISGSKINAVKIDELTREVREHNNFARRMPVVEEQIKVINHRIEDLEGKE